MEVLIKRNR